MTARINYIPAKIIRQNKNSNQSEFSSNRNKYKQEYQQVRALGSVQPACTDELKTSFLPLLVLKIF